MSRERELQPCPQCKKGTLRPTGDSERYTEETREFGLHTTLRCDNSDCGFQGRDLVRGS